MMWNSQYRPGTPGALYMRLASWMLHHLLSIPKAEQWGIVGPWAPFAMFLLFIGHCSQAVYKCFPCKKSSWIYFRQQCHVGCFQWFISIIYKHWTNPLSSLCQIWSLVPTNRRWINGSNWLYAETTWRVKAQCFSQHQSTGCETTRWDFSKLILSRFSSWSYSKSENNLNTQQHLSTETHPRPQDSGVVCHMAKVQTHLLLAVSWPEACNPRGRFRWSPVNHPAKRSSSKLETFAGPETCDVILVSVSVTGRNKAKQCGSKAYSNFPIQTMAHIFQKSFDLSSSPWNGQT